MTARPFLFFRSECGAACFARRHTAADTFTLRDCKHCLPNHVSNPSTWEFDMLHTLLENIGHNLFKPLLLFFYAGFLIPLLGVSFEFPQVIYQGLTIYLLLSIGWRGGEELAEKQQQ